MTDLFCGAGGESQGAAVHPWMDIRYAANHWEKAIETHSLNFPRTNHAIVNISQLDPRYFATTDILWASPECTNHSGAKGVKRAAQREAQRPDANGETLPLDAAERSRATMWDVVRFTEYHQYSLVIVENVVEAMQWVHWKAWKSAFHAMGYSIQVLYANSMHFPALGVRIAPQTRDRAYVICSRKGNRSPDLALRPKSYCPSCDQVVDGMQLFKARTASWPEPKWGRYKRQYIYTCPKRACARNEVAPLVAPALNAIDLTLPGQRIGDRSTPLREATLARIQRGLDRYCNVDQLVPAGGTWHTEPMPVTEPLRTRTTRDTDGYLAVPESALLIPTEGRCGKQAAPAGRPLRTLTTRAETALLVPYYGSTTTAQPAHRPIGTLTTRDRYGVAFLATLRGGGSKRDVRQLTEPLAAFCAAGFHHMLVREGQPDGPAHRPSEPVRIEDCTFRMLEPHEIQAGMAFHEDYRITGNRREKARQLGNAVTPPASEWILGRAGVSLGYSYAA